VRGEEILLRSDLERVALDAYSEVFEPSRKQVRDHQKAVKAAVAAAFERLADDVAEPVIAGVAREWLLNRAAMIRPQGVSSQGTPPAPRPAREFSDVATEPDGVTMVRDEAGDRWERGTDGLWHCYDDALQPPLAWHWLMVEFGPSLTEVLSEVVVPTDTDGPQ
jgi:hypothetical protein